MAVKPYDVRLCSNCTGKTEPLTYISLKTFKRNVHWVACFKLCADVSKFSRDMSNYIITILLVKQKPMIINSGVLAGFK